MKNIQKTLDGRTWKMQMGIQNQLDPIPENKEFVKSVHECTEMGVSVSSEKDLWRSVRILANTTQNLHINTNIHHSIEHSENENSEEKSNENNENKLSQNHTTIIDSNGQPKQNTQTNANANANANADYENSAPTIAIEDHSSPLSPDIQLSHNYSANITNTPIKFIQSPHNNKMLQIEIIPFSRNCIEMISSTPRTPILPPISPLILTDDNDTNTNQTQQNNNNRINDIENYQSKQN